MSGTGISLTPARLVCSSEGRVGCGGGGGYCIMNLVALVLVMIDNAMNLVAVEVMVGI